MKCSFTGHVVNLPKFIHCQEKHMNQGKPFSELAR